METSTAELTQDQTTAVAQTRIQEDDWQLEVKACLIDNPECEACQ